MRRQNIWISWLLVIALMAGLMTGGLAEQEDEADWDGPAGWYDAPMTMLYGVGRKLLTGTENFTATGTADFELDGVLFKHAEGILAQENENAYQSISLKSPRADGTERENGYAVVDYEGMGYVMERYQGENHVVAISNVPKSAALRDSVRTDMLLNLGEQIAAGLDAQILSQVTVTSDEEDMAHQLHWEAESFPALAQTSLNLLWQAAIQRYFFIDYDAISTYAEAAIEDYATTTQGILFCTRELELQELTLDAEFDKEDQLISLAGSMRIKLECRNEAFRMLGITFSLQGKDYGTTSIPDVIPPEDQNAAFITESLSPEDIPAYFQTASARGFHWSELGLPEVYFPSETLNHRVISNVEDAEQYAIQIASLDLMGIHNAFLMDWIVAQYPETGWYEARGTFPEDPDAAESALTLVFDQTGFVWAIHNEGSGLEDAEVFESDQLDSDTWTDWRGEIGLALWLFQEHLNPGSTRVYAEALREMRASGTGYAGYHETLAQGEETQFVVMYGMLHQNPQEKVKYVVQTVPTFRIVEMDATVDPEEGGNG